MTYARSIWCTDLRISNLILLGPGYLVCMLHALLVSVKYRYRLEVPRATDLYRVVLCVHYIMNNIYYAINVCKGAQCVYVYVYVYTMWQVCTKCVIVCMYVRVCACVCVLLGKRIGS